MLLGGALLALSLGVLPLSLESRLALAVVLGLLQCGWARRQRWSLSQLLAWLLALLLLGGWGWLDGPSPPPRIRFSGFRPTSSRCAFSWTHGCCRTRGRSAWRVRP